MNPSQDPNLNSGNVDDFYAESSKDLEDGLKATEISLTNEEIDRMFNARFANATNDQVFDVSNPKGARNMIDNSVNTTAKMVA